MILLLTVCVVALRHNTRPIRGQRLQVFDFSGFSLSLVHILVLRRQLIPHGCNNRRNLSERSVRILCLDRRLGVPEEERICRDRFLWFVGIFFLFLALRFGLLVGCGGCCCCCRCGGRICSGHIVVGAHHGSGQLLVFASIEFVVVQRFGRWSFKTVGTKTAVVAVIAGRSIFGECLG